MKPKLKSQVEHRFLQVVNNDNIFAIKFTLKSSFFKCIYGTYEDIKTPNILQCLYTNIPINMFKVA